MKKTFKKLIALTSAVSLTTALSVARMQQQFSDFCRCRKGSEQSRGRCRNKSGELTDAAASQDTSDGYGLHIRG